MSEIVYNYSDHTFMQGGNGLRLGDQSEGRRDAIEGSLYVGQLPLQNTYKLREEAIPVVVDNTGFNGCIEKVYVACVAGLCLRHCYF